jgi:hypothetical protein
METLTSISYTDNELGEDATAVLVGWLRDRKETNIKSLILCNLKTSAKNINNLLRADAEKLKLERIRVSGINLQEHSSKPEDSYDNIT